MDPLIDVSMIGIKVEVVMRIVEETLTVQDQETTGMAVDETMDLGKADGSVDKVAEIETEGLAGGAIRASPREEETQVMEREQVKVDLGVEAEALVRTIEGDRHLLVDLLLRLDDDDRLPR